MKNKIIIFLSALVIIQAGSSYYTASVIKEMSKEYTDLQDALIACAVSFGESLPENHAIYPLETD